MSYLANAAAPPIETTSNTLPKTEPPASDPAQKAGHETIVAGSSTGQATTTVESDGPPPPPTTGAGKGMPLDVASALDSIASAAASVLPTAVSSALGVAPLPPVTTATTTTTASANTHAEQAPLSAVSASEGNPKVQALKAMFPDFDSVILQSVLQSVGDDQDRAIDVLLGMNDPTYVSTTSTHNPETDLDEELARRLAIEDEGSRALRSEERVQAQNPTYAPYLGQHAIGAAWGHGNLDTSQTGASGKDTMTEIQEQFTRITDTGKKTFSSLFNKVKTKIAEFEQQQTTGYEKYQQDPEHPLYRAPEPAPAVQPIVQQQPKKNSIPNSYFDSNLGAAGPSGTTHQGNTPQIPMASPGYGPSSNAPTAVTPALSTITASPPMSPPQPSMIPSALVSAPDTSTAVVPPKQPDVHVEDTTTAKPIAERKPTDDNDLGYI